MTSNQHGGILTKLVALLLLIVVGGVVYLLRHPLLRMAGNFWVVEDSLLPSDAILLLGDDDVNADRAARAAELYRDRWAPRIVASGRLLRHYAGLPELMQHDLAERGVPAGAVIRFAHTADSTLEEAQRLKDLALRNGWTRVLVVTSNYHTRRARYIFRRVFPPGIEVRVVAAQDSAYDPSHWWESRRGVKLFFREALGFCVAMWELRHAGEKGNAAPATSPEPARP